MKATLEDHQAALPQTQYDHVIKEAIRQALRDRKAIESKPRLEKLKCMMEMELDAQARALMLYMINGGLGKGTILLNLQLEAVHNSCIELARNVLDEPEFNT